MPSSKDFVTFIGAGNVAWHLAPALENAGFAVKEVYSRNMANAEALVGRLYQAVPVSLLNFSASPSDIFIVAVSDDALTEVAQELVLPDEAIIAHTSGSQPISALGYAATPNVGVFYPLQTFSKGRKVEFERIPILVEAETRSAEQILMRMARGISKTTRKINHSERLTIHLSAVFASNFTNHMLGIAKGIMETRRLDFDLLKPLIAETVAKAAVLDPRRAQTGPARRGDLRILDRHLSLLEGDDQLTEIYRMISQHILDAYQPD